MKRWLAVIFIVGLMAFFLACSPQLSSRDSPASRPIIPPGEPRLNTQVVTPTPTPTPTPPPPWYIPTRPPVPDNAPRPTPYPPAKNESELLAQQAEIDRKSRETGGFVTKAMGPETKGIIIPIAGKQVKLPDDAYVKQHVVEILCGSGVPCPKTPLEVISRGKSTITVSLSDGQISGEEIAPGEEGIFSFLEKELPPQVTGVRTRGVTLRITGRDIKLPDDSSVGAIITDKDMVPGRDCTPPPRTPQPWELPSCPKTPVYGIAKQGAGIWISAVDGKIWRESSEYAKAQGIFEAIKRQLP